MEPEIFDIACLFMAFFLPPLSVMMKRGLHKEFWIGVVLTFLGWFPGIIYALYIIGKFPHERQWPAPHPDAAPVSTGTTPVTGDGPVTGTDNTSTSVHGASIPHQPKVGPAYDSVSDQPSAPIHDHSIASDTVPAPATLPRDTTTSSRAIPSTVFPPP